MDTEAPTTHRAFVAPPIAEVVNISSLSGTVGFEPLFEAVGGSPSGGTLRRAPAIAIWMALVATLLLLAMTLEILRRYLYPLGSDATLALLFQLPSVLVALSFVWQRQRKRDLCFSLRACACIPLLHAALLVGVQSMWSSTLINRNDSWWWRLNYAEQFPSWTIIAIAAGLLSLALAWSSTRKTEARILPWLLPLTIFAVSFLLVLGLWLPLACARYAAFEEWHWVLRAPRIVREHFVWIVLLPPALLALGVSLLPSSRRIQRVASSPPLQTFGTGLLAIVVLIAIGARARASSEQILAYANFVPVMLCAAALCILCITALALAHWQTLRRVQRSSLRPAPWRQEGTILSSPKSGPPGVLRYLGWLRGVQVETSSFMLQTSEGPIAIPSGSQLIAPIPLWTTTAPRGAWRALLRNGDRVTASGFVSSIGDNPYRSSPLPIVGSEGIVIVKRQSQPSDMWQELTLATWRPTLLYLGVSAIVALPGLAGFFAL